MHPLRDSVASGQVIGGQLQKGEAAHRSPLCSAVAAGGRVMLKNRLPLFFLPSRSGRPGDSKEANEGILHDVSALPHQCQHSCQRTGNEHVHFPPPPQLDLILYGNFCRGLLYFIKQRQKTSLKWTVLSFFMIPFFLNWVLTLFFMFLFPHTGFYYPLRSPAHLQPPDGVRRQGTPGALGLFPRRLATGGAALLHFEPCLHWPGRRHK